MQRFFYILRKSFFLLIFASITMIILSVFSCTADGIWDIMSRQIDIEEEIGGWKKRIKITIDNSAQSENLANFPVLVKLNSGNITYSDFKSGGSDLTFYTPALDDRLDYEIDTWNISGDSFIWVKIPSISGSSSSGYFWMYYSSDINSGTQDPDAVWSDDYKGVWHLGEDGSSYEDSSPYNNTGTGGSAPQEDPVLYAAGQIGAGQRDFYTAGSIVVSADGSINDLGPVTYSFWVNYGALGGTYLLSKDTIRILETTDTTIRVEIGFSGGVLHKEFECMTNNVWYNIAVTWNGDSNTSNLLLYQDGVPVAPGSTANTSGIKSTDEGSALYLGNHIAPNTVGKHCRLDEFRISGKIRSADWINAQYLSQSGSYLLYSSTEDL